MSGPTLFSGRAKSYPRYLVVELTDKREGVVRHEATPDLALAIARAGQAERCAVVERLARQDSPDVGQRVALSEYLPGSRRSLLCSL